MEKTHKEEPAKKDSFYVSSVSLCPNVRCCIGSNAFSVCMAQGLTYMYTSPYYGYMQMTEAAGH